MSIPELIGAFRPRHAVGRIITAMPTGPGTSAEAARADRSARSGARLERARGGGRSALDAVGRDARPRPEIVISDGSGRSVADGVPRGPAR
ncbi:MAG: hypothetical protein V7637_5159 [Mycobacteriales bacterium]